MARTVADVVASARRTLNDEDSSPRNSTSELEGYALDALNFIRQRRPDLFIGNWGELAAVTGTASLPLDAQYFRPIVDYVIARAETKDDEAVISARAKLMADMAGGFLQ